jgi:hypothetical protein
MAFPYIVGYIYTIYHLLIHYLDLKIQPTTKPAHQPAQDKYFGNKVFQYHSTVFKYHVYQSIFYMVSWHMIFDCSCSWNIVASSWKVHAFFSFILKEKKTSISMVGHMQKSETFAELSQCQSVAPSLAPSSLSLPFCTRFSLSRIQYYLYISLPPWLLPPPPHPLLPPPPPLPRLL